MTDSEGVFSNQLNGASTSSGQWFSLLMLSFWKQPSSYPSMQGPEPQPARPSAERLLLVFSPPFPLQFWPLASRSFSEA
jgi:hypothetical protein